MGGGGFDRWDSELIAEQRARDMTQPTPCSRCYGPGHRAADCEGGLQDWILAHLGRGGSMAPSQIAGRLNAPVDDVRRECLSLANAGLIALDADLRYFTPRQVRRGFGEGPSQWRGLLAPFRDEFIAEAATGRAAAVAVCEAMGWKVPR